MAFNLVVASGKGGTGKTTVAVGLAWTLARRGERVRLLDCDVEEPNAGLFLQPEFGEAEPVEVKKPRWVEEKCTGCGECVKACRYNALALVKGKVLFFNELCHACGVCSWVCPEGALVEESVRIGEVRVSEGPQPFVFVEGRVEVGESRAPTVVRAVKERAGSDEETINIVDAAPGAACPVVEAMRGADMVWLVTEPTPFGASDLLVAAELAAELGIPAGILINRWDGEDGVVGELAEKLGVPVIGRLPLRREYAEAYARGRNPAVEFADLAERLREAYELCLGCVPAGSGTRWLRSPLRGGGPRERKAGEVKGGGGRPPVEIAVISGKGGTGKTTVVSSFAAMMAPGRGVLVDTDVDAADLYLMFETAVRERGEFKGSAKARIDAAQCAGCRICREACHFDAIRETGGPEGEVICEVEETACEGCGLCARVCPVGAIEMEERVTGEWYVADSEKGVMVFARLGAGEENSGRLVSMVRRRGAQAAVEGGCGLILGDGPPGIGCPVISAITDVDLVVVVTEPTVSGVSDLGRVLELCRHFGTPAGVVINKADLDREQALRIEEMAGQYGCPVLGWIPYDGEALAAVRAGVPLVKFSRGPAARGLEKAWEGLRKMVRERFGVDIMGEIADQDQTARTKNKDGQGGTE